uniref:Uncharacterized protein n=1 Tax=Glossina palpalis gambiensis TaxID=67801 RepID=A0A1B0C5W3_9MUSC
MPHAEQKILNDPTNLVIIRLLERLADSKSSCLNNRFWLSAFYEELLENKQRDKIHFDFLSIGILVITRIRQYFANKRFPLFWNSNTDMLKYSLKVSLFRRKLAQL